MLAGTLAESVSSRFIGRETLSPELRWRAIEEDTRHGLLASTCMHTYTFMNMHTYKKGYSQAGKPPSTARKEP